MSATRRLITALALSSLLAFPAGVSARQRRTARTHAAKSEARKEESAKREKSDVPNLVSGQQVIEGTPDNNTVNVALAPGGVCMVEFPARDSILRAHPADQNLVTVDDTDAKSGPNFPLIFRPGTGFVVSKRGPELAAIITVQMASGVVFVFQVYPVARVKQSASHIYVRYDRDKIVAARRAAGLPVNYKPVPLRPGVYAPEETIEVAQVPPSQPPAVRLDNVPSASPTPAAAAPTPTPIPPPPPRSSTPAATPSPTPVSASPAVSVSPAVTPVFGGSIGTQPQPTPARSDVVRTVPVSSPAPATPRVVDANAANNRSLPPPSTNGGVVAARSHTDERPRTSGTTAISASLRDYIREVVSDSKAFSRPSKPLYGLSVSVSRAKDLNLETRFIVIAVRNTLGESVRLVPGQPDLFVETLDDKKSPVLVEPILKLGVETTAPNGDLLAPGATAYYAVAFTPPILGTHQYLRISVAQTTAADAPSSVDLTIKSR
jgi:hypothetical protein